MFDPPCTDWGAYICTATFCIMKTSFCCQEISLLIVSVLFNTQDCLLLLRTFPNTVSFLRSRSDTQKAIHRTNSCVNWKIRYESKRSSLKLFKLMHVFYGEFKNLKPICHPWQCVNLPQCATSGGVTPEQPYASAPIIAYKVRRPVCTFAAMSRVPARSTPRWTSEGLGAMVPHQGSMCRGMSLSYLQPGPPLQT